MLGQLVCIDRRYQRMNCFNIREVQSLLKRKFFHDLVVSSDYHTLLNNTIINLRYKTSNISVLDSNSYLLNQTGINYTPSVRFMDFSNNNVNTTKDYLSYNSTLMTNLLDKYIISDFIHYIKTMFFGTAFSNDLASLKMYSGLFTDGVRN